MDEHRLRGIRRGAGARQGACVYIFRKGELLYVNSRFEQSSGYGRREISAVDPMQTLAAQGDPAVRPLAAEVQQKLQRVIASL